MRHKCPKKCHAMIMLVLTPAYVLIICVVLVLLGQLAPRPKLMAVLEHNKRNHTQEGAE